MSEKNSFQQIQKQLQEQIQTQRATQNQVMLGRLIEMNEDELKDRIEMELDDNPALEESDSQETADQFEETNDQSEDNNETGEDNKEDPFESPYTQTDDDYDDREDDGLAYIMTSRRRRSDNEVYRPPVVNEASMFEVLMSQVRERDLTERQMLIAEFIVGEIDDDGLLRRSVPSICGDIISRENEFVTPDEVQEVLEVIQDLEPAGIGATSTRECILLQIEDMKGVNMEIAQLAYTIVDKYFEAYERHHYEKIINALNIDEETFSLADKIIKRTNPKPGNIFSSGKRMENASHITPDFEVRSEGKTLHLTVRNDIPELQISESYQLEYDRLSKKKNNKVTDEETLIRSQYENAGNFIMLLKMRQEKLHNIMKAIIIKQQEFFASGDPMTLKPMVLNDIAEATGYDVSTISRARNNKYVDTNWGIFDLKYFFSKGIDDNDTSSIAIKEIIKDLVDHENKRKPLSDEQLCKELRERGYPVARRTVAKYRSALRIPVARQRKEL